MTNAFNKTKAEVTFETDRREDRRGGSVIMEAEIGIMCL